MFTLIDILRRQFTQRYKRQEEESDGIRKNSVKLVRGYVVREENNCTLKISVLKT